MTSSAGNAPEIWGYLKSYGGMVSKSTLSSAGDYFVRDTWGYYWGGFWFGWTRKARRAKLYRNPADADWLKDRYYEREPEMYRRKEHESWCDSQESQGNEMSTLW